MAIDFTRYQTPGVYTESVGGPQLSVRSSVPTAVGIFGLSVGYRTFRESLKINPDTADVTTVQTVSLILASGGTFTLTFSGQTTTALAYNATASAVQTALIALSNLGPDDVTVTGSGGGPYAVSFVGDVAEMTANAGSLTSPAATIAVVHTTTGTTGIDDVQTVTIANSPTGGTFTLSFAGQTTSAIAYNATAGTVQTAFQALSTVGSGNATVTGGPGPNSSWTITFGGTLAAAAQAAITATGSLTGNASPTILVAIEQLGTPAINRTLAQRGILTNTIVVVNPTSGYTYTLGTDYTVFRITAGEDAVANTRDDLYTIQRVIDGGNIESGETVQLAYNYTDPDYHKVYSLYDYDDVRDFYGEPFDANGGIQSELTLAAKFAFTNGASTVLTVAVDPANPSAPNITDYSNAMDKFRDEDQIAIIVPATGLSAIQPLVQQHVVAQSNNRYERRSIIGMDGSSNIVASTQRINNAEALTEQRIALISPSRFLYLAPELNRVINLGGQYMAAAVAGKSVSQIAAMPLTRKTLLGFQGPAEDQRDGQKMLESSNGLMVVEKTRRNLVQVRHGVTTNPTDLLTREWSIIGQQDVMVYRIRDYLDNDGLIGMPIYDTTLVQVKASAESALVSLVRDAVIDAYKNLKVRQIGTQPDVIEVRYEWRPAYPLNYIVVRYSVDPSTGDVFATDTSTTA